MVAKKRLFAMVSRDLRHSTIPVLCWPAESTKFSPRPSSEDPPPSLQLELILGWEA
jgi:hypothetical protein